MRTLCIFFFSSIILTGFLSGMGFANAVGYIPAMEVTATSAMITFWKNTDHFMRARMPVLGNAVLLSLLVTTVLLARKKPVDRMAFTLAGLAFALQIADLTIIFTQNLPVNEVLENLDPNTIPESFEAQKQTAIRAYYLRAGCNIAAALCITLAYFRFESVNRFRQVKQILEKAHAA